MSDRHCEWRMVGADRGWNMPPTNWLFRLPLARHLRALHGMFHVEKHNRFWGGGGLDSNRLRRMGHLRDLARIGERKMTEIDDFRRAMLRLPPPIECFANGAVCPWCGWVHQTVTFGANICIDCKRAFTFGYPPWGADLSSYVPFPWREWDALGRRADLLPEWAPNDHLKHHYHIKAEDRTGIYADRSMPQ